MQLFSFFFFSPWRTRSGSAGGGLKYFSRPQSSRCPRGLRALRQVGPWANGGTAGLVGLGAPGELTEIKGRTPQGPQARPREDVKSKGFKHQAFGFSPW